LNDTTPVSEMTPEAAADEIAAVNADTSSAYWDGNHPDHARQVERVAQLHDIVHSEGPTEGPQPAYQEDPETGNTVTPEFTDNIQEAMTPPETPGDYDFANLRVQYGDDDTWDHDLENFIRPVFHKAGMSQEEAAGMGKLYLELQRYTPEQHENNYQTTLNVLEGKYGDGMQDALDSATRAAKAIGGQDFLNILNDSGMGSDSRVVELLLRVAKEQNL